MSQKRAVKSCDLIWHCKSLPTLLGTARCAKTAGVLIRFWHDSAVGWVITTMRYPVHKYILHVLGDRALFQRPLWIQFCQVFCAEDLPHAFSGRKRVFEDLSNFYTIQVGYVGDMYGYRHSVNPARLIKFNAMLPSMPYIERASPSIGRQNPSMHQHL